MPVAERRGNVEENRLPLAGLVVPDAPDDEVERLALAHPHVRAHTEGKHVDRVVVVRGRLVGVVAK